MSTKTQSETVNPSDNDTVEVSRGDLKRMRQTLRYANDRRSLTDTKFVQKWNTRSSAFQEHTWIKADLAMLDRALEPMERNDEG